MADHSAIEWTRSDDGTPGATWNPIRGLGPNRWMCRRISPGCDSCYASTMNHRWGGSEYLAAGDLTPPTVRIDVQALHAPTAWKKPRRIFVCSMTDLFGEWVPDEWIESVFRIMAICPQHQFQVLTKRPGRMREFTLNRHMGKYQELPLPNVWLGTSIELDRYAWRANLLRECPAVVRFISAEPLLGPLPSLDLSGISWLIAGGESGAHHRPCDPAWVRDLRDRCAETSAAFFFKQWGGRTHAQGGRTLDGRTWDEFPEPRRELVTV